MGRVRGMSDQEFAAWLKSVPRTVTPSEVERRERSKDAARGYYVNHHLHVHHTEESRH